MSICCHAVITLWALYDHESSSVQQWVCTFFIQSARMVDLSQIQYMMTLQKERRENETRWEMARRSGASSNFLLFSYYQSDHRQMGVTLVGNTFLINNYLHELKCTDATLLCPASTYFPTALLSPQFRIFCKTFIVQWHNAKNPFYQHAEWRLYIIFLFTLNYSSQSVYFGCLVLHVCLKVREENKKILNILFKLDGVDINQYISMFTNC